MNIRIGCIDDKGIDLLREIEVEQLPCSGDVIELDGLDFEVIGRRFSPDFSDSGIYGIKIILSRKD